jgi:biotin carboxylase
VARGAAEAIGVRDGPTYTQVLLGPDGPVVGELAARLGGGHDAELCEAALGVDLNALALAAALGEPISWGDLPRAEVAGGACIRFLVPAPGLLEAVERVEHAEDEEGVVWVRIYREPGHEFGVFRRGSDRAGAVLAVGAGRQAALDRATRAAERIRLVTAASDVLV